MDKIVITGGQRLKGEVRVSGAKNAALPILASAILSGGTSVFRNVPKLMDVRTMTKLLRMLGAATEDADKTGYAIAVNTDSIKSFDAPYELVKTMRASVLVLGPLVARHGRATVSMPGGCAIGARPIDQHLKGLEAMGAKISLEHGNVTAKAKRLRGAAIVCDVPTVTGTENLMMAAALAKGRTTIDEKDRVPLYREAQKLVSEDAPWIIVDHGKQVIVHRKRVQGFKLHPLNRQLFHNVTIQ